MQLLTHASETQNVPQRTIHRKLHSQGRTQCSLAMRDAKLLQNIDTQQALVNRCISKTYQLQNHVTINNSPQYRTGEGAIFGIFYKVITTH
jgi:hypothetical protein